MAQGKWEWPSTDYWWLESPECVYVSLFLLLKKKTASDFFLCLKTP